jgi:hypothetical protein
MRTLPEPDLLKPFVNVKDERDFLLVAQPKSESPCGVARRALVRQGLSLATAKRTLAQSR